MKVAKSLYDEDQMMRAVETIGSAGRGGHNCEDYLPRSLAIMRSWLLKCPTWKDSGDMSSNWEALVAYAYTASGPGMIFKKDALSLGYERVGNTYVKEDFGEFLLSLSITVDTRACRDLSRDVGTNPIKK